MNYILILLSFLVSNSPLQQESEEIFTVDVYINADRQVYLEDKLIKANEVEKEMSDYASRKKAFLEDSVLYRIYADRNLDMGFIMDINNQLISAFHPANTRTKRFLLYSEELDVNSTNWQHQIQKLDLKAIEN